MDNKDGSTYQSCDLMKFNYDGNTCAPGSSPIGPRVRGSIYNAPNGVCEGITCVHVLTGLEHTYNSCDILGFGFNGKMCGPGFRPKGSCGPMNYNAVCAAGECCSRHGFCGVGPSKFLSRIVSD